MKVTEARFPRFTTTGETSPFCTLPCTSCSSVTSEGCWLLCSCLLACLLEEFVAGLSLLPEEALLVPLDCFDGDGPDASRMFATCCLRRGGGPGDGRPSCSFAHRP